MYIGQIPVIIDQNAPPLSPIFCLNMERLEEHMAAITKAQETAKSARVDKAMDSMKKPEKQAGTLRHISIRPAENGYTVGVEREPDADDAKGKGKGDMPMSSYTPPKDSVFGGKTAKQDVLDHISKHLD